MISESLRSEVPEGGVVTFAHCVVVRGRAELQALGQQPCGQEGQLSGDWTRLDTRRHFPHPVANAVIDVSRDVLQTHSEQTYAACPFPQARADSDRLGYTGLHASKDTETTS